MARDVHPYVHLNGQALAAIAHYEQALGVKARDVMMWRDLPGAAPGSMADHLVMHARLPVGNGLLLVSDSHPDHPGPTTSNVTLHVELDDLADQARIFDALAAGGSVVMPLHRAFWGATFGQLVDRFGVSWMLHCPLVA